MINLNEISSEWLNQVSKQHRNVDKILVEKVVYAFCYKTYELKKLNHIIYELYELIVDRGGNGVHRKCFIKFVLCFIEEKSY